MDTIYLSVVDERHVDPTYKLFHGLDAAKQYTRDTFESMVSDPTRVEEFRVIDYLYYLAYADGESSAYVVTVEWGD